MFRIKALLDFMRTTPSNLLVRANVVFNGLNGNPAYSRLPVDLMVFRAEIDGFAESIAAAFDGGKQALAERNRRADVVAHLLLQYSHYVEVQCNGDMLTFLSSGFQPAPTARTQTAPLSKAIRKIVPGGNSGQMLVTLLASAEAYSYQLRFTPVGTETHDTWVIQSISTTRPATLLENLTPGTKYVFQARALTKSGFTNWSDPVSRMCT